MGYWRITIEGCGCHHNNNREIDANLATEDFVKELKAQGHQLTTAKFELTNAIKGGEVVESAGNIDFLAGQ